MPAPYAYIDDATGTVAAPGRLEGGASVPLADASAFPVGVWPKPARLVVRRNNKLRTVLKATGRSGSSLAVAGPLDGYVDKDLAAGDVVAISWTSGDVGDLWTALDAVEATPGPPGTPGTAATVAVGTVSTGAPGSAASVTNVGTSSAAILDFAIPQGLKGDQGDPGPNTISGLIAIPTDGSIAIEGGAGTAASPLRLRARAEMLLYRGRTPVGSAGAVGDFDQAVPAAIACSSLRVIVSAVANPAGAEGGAAVQVKVNGTGVLGSVLSLPAGSLGPVEATVTVAVASGANVLPSLTSINSGVRGLLVQVVGRAS